MAIITAVQIRRAGCIYRAELEHLLQIIARDRCDAACPSSPSVCTQSELQALLKRIDARRKEHIKQRNLDTKRLLQRNRNVQAVLESKQNVEGLKLAEEIKKVRQADSYVTLPELVTAQTQQILTKITA